MSRRLFRARLQHHIIYADLTKKPETFTEAQKAAFEARVKQLRQQQAVFYVSVTGQ